MIASKQGILNRILGRTGVTTKLENLQADSVLSPDVSADNYVINGGFDFWQRGVGPHSCTTSKKYSADRWCIFDGDNGQSSVSQVASSFSDCLYGLKMQRTNGQTGTSQKTLSQTFELKNAILLAGKTITLSFYAKAGANFSGTFTTRLSYGTGTADNHEIVFNGFVGTVHNDKLITLSTSFQKFTNTFKISGSAKQFGITFMWYPSGTAGADDSFTLEKIMLNIGSIDAPFIRAGKTIGQELALCQRYFCTRRWSYIGYVAGNAGYLTEAPIFPYPVIMRRNPDLTELSLSFELLNTPTYSTSANEYLRVSLSRDTAGGGSAFGNIAADAEI